VKEIDDGLKAIGLETMEPLAFKHIMTTLSDDDKKKMYRVRAGHRPKNQGRQP